MYRKGTHIYRLPVAGSLCARRARVSINAASSLYTHTREKDTERKTQRDLRVKEHVPKEFRIPGPGPRLAPPFASSSFRLHRWLSPPPQAPAHYSSCLTAHVEQGRNLSLRIACGRTLHCRRAHKNPVAWGYSRHRVLRGTPLTSTSACAHPTTPLLCASYVSQIPARSHSQHAARRISRRPAQPIS